MVWAMLFTKANVSVSVLPVSVHFKGIINCTIKSL